MNLNNETKIKELYRAFLSMKNETELANFTRDLMTESEIIEFAGRFAVAKDLYLGNSQRKVSANTGVSIATVTRVNQWLQRGMNGYKTALSRLLKNENHLHHTSKLLASNG